MAVLWAGAESCQGLMLSRPCTQRSMEGSAQSRAWGRPLGSRAAGPPPLPVDLGAEGSTSVLRELLPHSLLFPLVLRPGLGSIQGGVVCPTPVPSPPCAAAPWWWWWVSRSVVSDPRNPVGCSPPGSPVQGILQARILECVAIYFIIRAAKYNCLVFLCKV